MQALGLLVLLDVAEKNDGSSGNRVGKSNGECGLKAHRD
jgi:hypothetical protein